MSSKKVVSCREVLGETVTVASPLPTRIGPCLFYNSLKNSSWSQFKARTGAAMLSDSIGARISLQCHHGYAPFRRETDNNEVFLFRSTTHSMWLFLDLERPY